MLLESKVVKTIYTLVEEETKDSVGRTVILLNIYFVTGPVLGIYLGCLFDPWWLSPNKEEISPDLRDMILFI